MPLIVRHSRVAVEQEQELGHTGSSLPSHFSLLQGFSLPTAPDSESKEAVQISESANQRSKHKPCPQNRNRNSIRGHAYLHFASLDTNAMINLNLQYILEQTTLQTNIHGYNS